MTETNDIPNVGAGSEGAGDAMNPQEREPNTDARTWAMFCHLAGLAAFIPVVPAFGGVLGPLIVWLIKKDEFPFVNEQGKEALNFQITMLIYTIVAILLCFVCIGFVLAPAVLIADIVCIILASIKSKDGIHYRYPPYLIFRFVK